MDEERWVSAIDGWKTTIASVATVVGGAGYAAYVDGTAGMLLLVVGAVFGVLRWYTDSRARLRGLF